MKPQLPDLDSLIEEATLDCYGEEECRIGFTTMLEDELRTPFKAKLNGRAVTVTKIDDNDDRTIKVIVRYEEATFPVDILDLEVDHSIRGFEYIAAYRRWEKGK